jgi:AcrR family transcriptional regulator
MAAPRKIDAPVEASPRLAVVPKWRPDLDSRALPPTPQLTRGKRKVLQSCLELFVDKGYAASSIRDIADAAGMRSASLYAHFESKEAILTELVLIGYQHHLDRVLAAVLDAPPDPRDQLFAAIRTHVAVHCEFARLGIVSTTEFRHVSAAAKPALQSVNQQVSTIATEILQRGAERRLFVPTGHHVAILAMASMGIDAARWYPWQTEIDLDQLAEDFGRLALRMVCV